MVDACSRLNHAPRPQLTRRGVAALDHDGLDLAGAVTAEGRGLVVFRRGEAGDALLEGREFDHDETVKLVRPFHDLETPPARQDLAAIFGEDRRQAVGVFLVFGRIDDARARDPIGWHSALLAWLRDGFELMEAVKRDRVNVADAQRASVRLPEDHSCRAA